MARLLKNKLLRKPDLTKSRAEHINRPKLCYRWKLDSNLGLWPKSQEKKSRVNLNQVFPHVWILFIRTGATRDLTCTSRLATRVLGHDFTQQNVNCEICSWIVKSDFTRELWNPFVNCEIVIMTIKQEACQLFSWIVNFLRELWKVIFLVNCEFLGTLLAYDFPRELWIVNCEFSSWIVKSSLSKKRANFFRELWNLL